MLYKKIIIIRKSIRTLQNLTNDYETVYVRYNPFRQEFILIKMFYRTQSTGTLHYISAQTIDNEVYWTVTPLRDSYFTAKSDHIFKAIQAIYDHNNDTL